ncbi:phosphatidylserine decarboxylase [Aquimarina rhabdastrellae]
MDSIIFIDRKTGEKIKEQTPSSKMLSFLYGTIFGKISLHLLFKRKIVSVIGGWYMNSKASQKKIAPFISQYKMDMNEYICPSNGFQTFNDFFYRKIKPEARPIAQGIVSPADGKIVAFQSLKDVKSFFIKGTKFTVDSFLNNNTLAQRYKDGAMTIIRLAPVDYHRFHFPATGTVSATTLINGHYFSVSPLALRKSLDLFCQNIRTYSTLETEEHGSILISEVGATMVGSIIQTYTADAKIKKGDEKGYFAFGGSTLVLFFEKDTIQFNQDIIANTQMGFETVIKMGEQIAI